MGAQIWLGIRFASCLISTRSGFKIISQLPTAAFSHLKSLVSWDKTTFSTNFRGYFSLGLTKVIFLTCKSLIYQVLCKSWCRTFFLWSRIIFASIAEAATTPTPTSIGTKRMLSLLLASILIHSETGTDCSQLCERKEPRLTFIDSVALHSLKYGRTHFPGNNCS